MLGFDTDGLSGNVFDDLYTTTGGGRTLIGLVLGYDLIAGGGELIGAGFDAAGSVVDGLGETFSDPVG